MKKNVFIVISIIIILGMGGYLVYDKILGKEEVKTKKEIKEKVAEPTDTNENTTSDVYVVDGYHKVISGSFDETYEPSEEERKLELMYYVKLPKLTINSNNAEHLNEKILNDFSPMEKDKKTFKGVGSTHIDYTYYIKDNIIFIIITDEHSNNRGSGWTKYYGYYYDITNDEELSLEGVYKKLGFNINEINMEIEQKAGKLTESSEQFIIPSISSNSYELNITDNMQEYVISINSNN